MGYVDEEEMRRQLQDVQSMLCGEMIGNKKMNKGVTNGEMRKAERSGKCMNISYRRGQVIRRRNLEELIML